MGFGGAVSAMITSLKNNKRNRKSTFEKLEKFRKENNDKLYFKNAATKEELEEIRFKMKKENRISLIKNITLFTVVFIILCYIIGFVNF